MYGAVRVSTGQKVTLGLVNPHHRYGSVAVCFSLWVVVKPSPGRNSPCTLIKPSSAATPRATLAVPRLSPGQSSSRPGFSFGSAFASGFNEAGCGLFPGLMAAGWLQSYQIHSSSVDRDRSSVIAREDSQTAIRRGGTGRETRTSDLLGNGSALRRLFGLACHPRHRPKLSGWQTPQRPRRQRIL